MAELEGHDEILRKLIEAMPVEERLAGLTPEERMAGPPPEQRMAGLEPEDRAILFATLPLEILRALPRICSPSSRRRCERRSSVASQARQADLPPERTRQTSASSTACRCDGVDGDVGGPMGSSGASWKSKITATAARAAIARRARVEAGAVADASHARRPPARAHHHVELLGIPSPRRLAEADAALLHVLGRSTSGDHHARVGVDGRVGDALAAGAQGDVEGAQVDLVALLDGPEERERAGRLHRRQGEQLLDDARRPLGDGGRREGVAQRAGALAEYGLGAAGELALHLLVDLHGGREAYAAASVSPWRRRGLQPLLGSPGGRAPRGSARTPRSLSTPATALRTSSASPECCFSRPPTRVSLPMPSWTLRATSRRDACLCHRPRLRRRTYGGGGRPRARLRLAARGRGDRRRRRFCRRHRRRGAHRRGARAPHPQNRGRARRCEPGWPWPRARASTSRSVDADGQHPTPRRWPCSPRSPSRRPLLGIRDLEAAGAPRANRISNASPTSSCRVLRSGAARHAVRAAAHIRWSRRWRSVAAPTVWPSRRRSSSGAVAAGLRLVEVQVRVIYPRRARG